MSSWNAIATAVDDHHRAERALSAGPRGAPHAVEHAPAAEREHEQDDRRAERVGERRRATVRPEAAPTETTRGEDRAGARRVDEARARAPTSEARPEPVAARARARSAPAATAAPRAARATPGTRSASPNTSSTTIAMSRSETVAEPDAVDDRRQRRRS